MKLNGSGKSARRQTLIFLFLVILWPVSVRAQLHFLGPEGKPLPFETFQEVELFLMEAEVVSESRIGAGINNPLKCLLSREGVQAHAVFRDVSVKKASVKLGEETHRNFRDDAIFEVAAYELAKLLGLDTIPPTVVRKHKRKRGTIQLWVEGGMTEKVRIRKKQNPDDVEAWRQAISNMRVFDNLIYNDDRNQGNILFDSRWQLWLIDHGRTFRRHKTLFSPTIVRRCGDRLYQRLREVEDQAIKDRIGEYLHPSELKALLARRAVLLKLIDEQIGERGEAEVIFAM
jgi:hypothetical protein